MSDEETMLPEGYGTEEQEPNSLPASEVLTWEPSSQDWLPPSPDVTGVVPETQGLSGDGLDEDDPALQARAPSQRSQQPTRVWASPPVPVPRARSSTAAAGGSTKGPKKRAPSQAVKQVHPNPKRSKNPSGAASAAVGRQDMTPEMVRPVLCLFSRKRGSLAAAVFNMSSPIRRTRGRSISAPDG
jgi:hypothetical protein